MPTTAALVGLACGCAASFLQMHSHTSQVSSAGVTWLRWFFFFFFFPALRGLVQRHLGMVAAGRALVVLDFDWTVIEENSDTWVIDAIGAKHIYSRRVPSDGAAGGLAASRPRPTAASREQQRPGGPACVQAQSPGPAVDPAHGRHPGAGGVGSGHDAARH